MIGNILGPLISAGASLLGNSKDNKTQQANAERNIQQQREFAQNGIRWKVEDARAAGIHPIYALGAQTTSFSPISVGSNNAESFARAGQDISRAIDATRSQGERVDAAAKTAQALSLQKMGLENELLSAQIAKIRQAGNPPALPSPGERYLVDGQGATAASGFNGQYINTEAMKRAASDPARPWSEPGAINYMGYARTPTGWEPVPSKDMKERIEDDTIAEIMWSLKNRVLPITGFYNHPPNIPGKDFYYHPLLEYREYTRPDPNESRRYRFAR